MIVPLLAQRRWAAVNEAFHGTSLVNGYGARQVLGWLISGQLLDHGRLPVVTVFSALVLSCLALAVVALAPVCVRRTRRRRASPGAELRL